jgi:hypothetical protein
LLPCAQALSENKSWKHRIFKKSDKSGKAGHTPQHQQQHQEQEQPPPAVSPAAGSLLSPADAGASNGNGSSSTGKAKQQASPGWLFGGILGRKDKSKATAAAAAAAAGAADVLPGSQLSQELGMQEGPEQQQQQVEQPHQQGQLQHMLQLVSTQLQQLTVSICPPSGQTRAWGNAADTSSTAACAAAAGSAAAGQAAAVGDVLVQGGGLLELQELQRQHDSLPEVRQSPFLKSLQQLVASML